MRKGITLIFLQLVSIVLFSSQYHDPEIKLEKRLEYLEEIKSNPPNHKMLSDFPLFSNAFFSDHKFSNEYKTKLADEYFAKYEKLGLELNPYRALFYFFKINLNVLDKFKKFGIDPLALSAYRSLSPGALIYDPLLSNSLFRPVVLTGKVVNIEINNKIEENDFEAHGIKKRMSIEIIRFHKGSYLYENIPDTIHILMSKYDYTNYAYENFPEMGPRDLVLNKNDTVLVFFNGWQLQSQYKEVFKKEVNKQINNNEILNKISNNIVLPNRGVFLNRVFNNSIYYSYYLKYKKEYKKGIDEIEELERINDTENFYNRRYK